MPSTSFAQWGVVFRGDGRILSSDQLGEHEHFDRVQTLDVAPRIYEEYCRARQTVGEEDPYASDKTLGVHEVLKAHFLIADFFFAEGEGMGGIGLMNPDGLHSALQRQHVTWGRNVKWQSVHEICATLLFGLIKNHPFYDANKRTAFLSSLYFLYKNKMTLKISHKEFEDFTVEIAEPKIRRKRNKAVDIRDMDRDVDKEIRRIAKSLKRFTRPLDKRHYTVTYKQLDKILRRFGFYLDDMKGNWIHVMESPERKKGFFRFSKSPRRVTRIGFPGWGRQVSKGDVKKVRDMTELTHKKGVDSQVFFKGLDPTDTLLIHYQDALRRLADR